MAARAAPCSTGVVNAIDVFGKIYDLPPIVRNRLLSAGIPRVIPIAGGLRIRVEDVDDARAVTTMPFTRRGRNHVGSLYLGALLVHAEATMAALAVGVCRAPAFRVLVKRNEADFHSRAACTVRAVCAPEGEEREGLARCRALVDDKAETWLTVKTTTAAEGTPVCTVRFLISVRQRSGG